eukprot:Rhum_TRINITY_DN23523_c0_g1::Rhum_TRINITY_DN23523_c0_g1_i1::g.178240::m.178240
MKNATLLLIVIIAVSICIVLVLGAVAWQLWTMSQGNARENETDQQMEKRLIDASQEETGTKERQMLERMVFAKVQEVEQKMLDMRQAEQMLLKQFANRYFQHTHVEGQDPDTLDMDPQQREMRKQIKELQIRVEERAKDRKKKRRQQEQEDKKDRASRAKGELTGKYNNYIDDFFENRASADKQRELAALKSDGVTFDNETDFLRFMLPTKTIRRQEEMGRLKRMQTHQDHKETFHNIDADHSGGIDKEEMRQRIGDVVGHEVTDERLDAMFAMMDRDGNGVVDLEEFLDYCANELEDHDDWWDRSTAHGSDHDLTEAAELRGTIGAGARSHHAGRAGRGGSPSAPHQRSGTGVGGGGGGGGGAGGAGGDGGDGGAWKHGEGFRI